MKYNNVYEEAVSLEGVVIITDVPVDSDGLEHPIISLATAEKTLHLGSHLGELSSVTLKKTDTMIFVMYMGDPRPIDDIMRIKLPHTRYTILKYYFSAPKRCPHCGGEATVAPTFGNYMGHRVTCNICGIMTPNCGRRIDAINIWNGDKQ